MNNFLLGLGTGLLVGGCFGVLLMGLIIGGKSGE